MLEPLDRGHFLQVLRPPDGYEVDVALGTTYSLDLMTLLSVPLSFALFDWEDDEGQATHDPLILLEALRRYADKIHVFCQAGGIHLPAKTSPLFCHLEKMVHEVKAPRERGVFHPKVWVIRFRPVSKNDPVLYRVLCLSRNLTYDRSWDTMLVLNGELIDRALAFSGNHPLGDFIKVLPSLKLVAADSELRKNISKVQDEIRRVKFDVPAGFSGVSFHPLGIDDNTDWFFPASCKRMLAMSPFVDAQVVNRLVKQTQGGCVLVSRPDQLAEINPKSLGACEKVYILDSNADGEREEGDGEESLVGLHAKLFITDNGWQSSVWTGSANATNAAFSRNVEFLCELHGKRSVYGVDAFLKQVKGESRFINLLRPYSISESPKEADSDEQQAESRAEDLRRIIIVSILQGAVTPQSGTELYDFELTCSNVKRKVLQENLSLRVWPVNLPGDVACNGLPLLEGAAIRFQGLSLGALSGFMAFQIDAVVGKCKKSLRFVCNVPVVGFPDDRVQKLMLSVLQNRNQVLRLLLLLLADSNNDLWSSFEQGRETLEVAGSNGNTSIFGGQAMLEPLLKTLERNPEKLVRIAKLIDDLRKAPEGLDLLPVGFLSIWEPIWNVAETLMHKHE
jgi:hypothetical protein